MTQFQFCVWLGFIVLSFVLGFYCGKYDEQD